MLGTSGTGKRKAPASQHEHEQQRKRFRGDETTCELLRLAQGFLNMFTTSDALKGTNTEARAAPSTPKGNTASPALPSAAELYSARRVYLLGAECTTSPPIWTLGVLDVPTQELQVVVLGDECEERLAIAAACTALSNSRAPVDVARQPDLTPRSLLKRLRKHEKSWLPSSDCATVATLVATALSLFADEREINDFDLDDDFNSLPWYLAMQAVDASAPQFTSPPFANTWEAIEKLFKVYYYRVPTEDTQGPKSAPRQDILCRIASLREDVALQISKYNNDIAFVDALNREQDHLLRFCSDFCAARCNTGHEDYEAFRRGTETKIRAQEGIIAAYQDEQTAPEYIEAVKREHDLRATLDLKQHQASQAADFYRFLSALALLGQDVQRYCIQYRETAVSGKRTLLDAIRGFMTID